MPYTLLAGEFVIARPGRPSEGPEPDGDTIRFVPRSPRLVDLLPRQRIGPDWRMIDGVAQVNVRFEAIDTLETHFQGSHQPLGSAYAARDRMIELMGFGAVTFLPTNPNKVATVEHHPVPGYVLSNGIDGNGRVIGFVQPGPPPFPDGAVVRIDGDQVDASVSAALLAEGLGYPIFYSSLPADLREHLRPSVERARAARIGLWASSSGDPSGRPAAVRDLAALEAAVIWPKLYRRLHEFFASGRRDLTVFDGWLRGTKDDRIMVLEAGVPGRLLPGELGHLHDVVTVDAAAGTVRLELHPEQFVILEGTAEPSEPTVPVVLSDLRIVAAVVNPITGDRGRETVTVLNAGAEPVDLSGWSVTDARGTGHDPLPAQVLAAGNALRCRLARVQLGNDGDTILLVAPDGTLGDRVTYTADEARTPGVSLTFSRLTG
jgi:endonuclease YncB( thermonuclease family)